MTPVKLGTQDDGWSYGLLWCLFELNGRQAYAAIGSSGQGVLVVLAAWAGSAECQALRRKWAVGSGTSLSRRRELPPWPAGCC